MRSYLVYKGSTLNGSNIAVHIVVNGWLWSPSSWGRNAGLQKTLQGYRWGVATVATCPNRDIAVDKNCMIWLQKNIQWTVLLQCTYLKKWVRFCVRFLAGKWDFLNDFQTLLTFLFNWFSCEVKKWRMGVFVFSTPLVFIQAWSYDSYPSWGDGDLGQQQFSFLIIIKRPVEFLMSIMRWSYRCLWCPSSFSMRWTVLEVHFSARRARVIESKR